MNGVELRHAHLGPSPDQDQSAPGPNMLSDVGDTISFVKGSIIVHHILVCWDTLLRHTLMCVDPDVWKCKSRLCMVDGLN